MISDTDIELVARRMCVELGLDPYEIVRAGRERVFYMACWQAFTIEALKYCAAHRAMQALPERD